MQEIFQIIEHKKNIFSQLPLFKFMQDKSISPEARISFAPCMAFFIMGFGDLNKYVLRDLNNNSPVQKIINDHTNEDDNHWPWYIRDIENLNLDINWSFNDSLLFFWSDKTKLTRQIVYQIAGYSLRSEPIVKLAIIEALEAMGNVFFFNSTKVISELNSLNHKQYIYFGDDHLKVETGHTMGTSGAENFLESVELTPTQREQALEAVDKIFQVFSEWTYELLAYAQAQDPDQTNSKQSDLLTACS
ncbi:hypothetical protein [Calothrix sp. NIES-3974]|uniref:hypothetical protein n=1 Tax=Calothrix sp. NIES-3974 TaxID=2005462 RepID=UPI000B608BCE|nr:hypothetical protein [Calothrix sp. NIES-3974]BAZ08003.1 hypothetical protein NIES3974_46710 [Calothrix sp. NIES-3974]